MRAHARARGATGWRPTLVFAGAGRLAERLRAPGRARARATCPTPSSTLLYAGALALVMPSRLEGFGWPPLDAIARGTPAVVAALPVYEETLGAAGALRVPPGDEAALAAALRRIAGDAPLRSGSWPPGARRSSRSPGSGRRPARTRC